MTAFPFAYIPIAVRDDKLVFLLVSQLGCHQAGCFRRGLRLFFVGWITVPSVKETSHRSTMFRGNHSFLRVDVREWTVQESLFAAIYRRWVDVCGR